MSEVDSGQPEQAIESRHGGVAIYAQSAPAREIFEGKNVRDGAVQIVNLAGHPMSTRAHAWSTTATAGGGGSSPCCTGA